MITAMPPNDDHPSGTDTPLASDFLEFENLAKDSASPGRGLVAAFATLAVLAGVGAGVWVYFNGGMDALAPKSPLPVIQPPAGEAKTRPATPGGMAVPDRDKLVYGRLDGTSQGEKFERLLPPPESPIEPPTEPIQTPEVPAPPLADSAPPPLPEPVPEATAEPPTPPPATPEAEAPPPPPPPLPEPITSSAPAPEPRIATPALPRLPAPPLAAGGYRIQMGALKTEAAAAAEWRRLVGAYPALLGGLGPEFERADLGDRGVFWRLRAGVVADRAAAEALCAQLKALKVGCLVVSP